jgi:hypothetical protein
MADITSKTALAPVTPKAAEKSGHSHIETGGGSGFSSLPSSIHHGLSERLHGITEKLQALGQRSTDSEPMRSRTSSLGAGVHPSLAVTTTSKGSGAGAGAVGGPMERVIRSSQTSPSRTCSRASSKKSNHSTVVSNGKVGEGKIKGQS